jgi:hypothetical protein
MVNRGNVVSVGRGQGFQPFQLDGHAQLGPHRLRLVLVEYAGSDGYALRDVNADG